MWGFHSNRNWQRWDSGRMKTKKVISGMGILFFNFFLSSPVLSYSPVAFVIYRFPYILFPSLLQLNYQKIPRWNFLALKILWFILHCHFTPPTSLLHIFIEIIFSKNRISLPNELNTILHHHSSSHPPFPLCKSCIFLHVCHPQTAFWCSANL